jgi:ferritin-like metal-binding protein YciE
VDQIRDLYDAEKQLVRALPKMAKAAESEELAEAINNHLEETKNQVSRLEQVFEELEKPNKGKPCKAMKGLVEEGSETIDEDSAAPMGDLGIIAAAQRVEHYEISAYGTAKALARHLGLENVVTLLEETEEEEKAADEKLTEVATTLMEQAGTGDEGEEVGAGRTASKKSASGRGNARSARR